MKCVLVTPSPLTPTARRGDRTCVDWANSASYISSFPRPGPATLGPPNARCRSVGGQTMARTSQDRAPLARKNNVRVTHHWRNTDVQNPDYILWSRDRRPHQLVARVDGAASSPGGSRRRDLDGWSRDSASRPASGSRRRRAQLRSKVWPPRPRGGDLNSRGSLLDLKYSSFDQQPVCLRRYAFN